MKTNTKTAPTLRDVAQACGVSEATVSYVVNGKKTLRTETRERVFRAMREMNYHPNAVARGLQQKRVHTLGVLFGQIDPAICLKDDYMTGVLAGVMTRSQAEGFNVALFTEPWNDSKPNMTLRDGRTDGILAMAPLLDSGILEGLSELGVPIVAVAGGEKNGISVVDADNYMGARLAVEHLIALGHRRIAYLSGGVNLSCYLPRRAGWMDALRDAGLEADPQLEHVTCFMRNESFEKTRQLLQLPSPPTAIFAGNDTAAVGVLEAARSLTVQVPQQLSVVGFDDVPLSSLVSPALTTVRQPLQAIGETAATLLIEQICRSGGAQSAQTILLPPELIVRGSTAPCPS